MIHNAVVPVASLILKIKGEITPLVGFVACAGHGHWGSLGAVAVQSRERTANQILGSDF